MLGRLLRPAAGAHIAASLLCDTAQGARPPAHAATQKAPLMVDSLASVVCVLLNDSSQASFVTYLGRFLESCQGVGDAGVLLQGRRQPWHALRSHQMSPDAGSLSTKQRALSKTDALQL